MRSPGQENVSSTSGPILAQMAERCPYGPFCSTVPHGSSMGLLAGNDQHVAAAEQSNAGAGEGLVQIVPANDTLFTSGSLGRYSRMLNSVIENHRAPSGKEVMAD